MALEIPENYRRLDLNAAKDLLGLYIEIGIDEPLNEDSINRYHSIERVSPKRSKSIRPVSATEIEQKVEKQLSAEAEPKEDPGRVAQSLADATNNLSDLRNAMKSYEFCEIKKGARNLVFSDGNPAAKVMIVGEAPGQEEDRVGHPFVGKAGQLLDRMFAAIGLDRNEDAADRALYISNILPWRPPGNRNPTKEEVGMMLPFIVRHIELANPVLLVLTGNTPCSALLGRSGITKLRGNWTSFKAIPVMPTFHPAFLLRNPIAKREVWKDLLEIRKKLGELQ